MNGFSSMHSQPEARDEASPIARIGRMSRKQVSPISFIQEACWSSQQEQSPAFGYWTAALRLRGKLNRRALIVALDRIVARHAVLRSTFPTIDGQPAQLAEPSDCGFALVEQKVESEVGVEAARQKELATPFDLLTGPVTRGRLLRVSKNEHVLLITHHPLVCDRWSRDVFVNELLDLYEAFALERDDPLPPLEAQFVDFVYWQRQQLTHDVLQGQLTFWKQKMSGAAELMKLPTDRPRRDVWQHPCERARLKLSAGLSRSLRRLAREEEVTLFATLMSGWAALLSRWTGESEIVIGTSASGRRQAPFKAAIGPFDNRVALRLSLPASLDTRALLKHVSAVIAEARAHQDVPFDRVVESLCAAGGERARLQVTMDLNDRPAASLMEAERRVAGLSVSEAHIGARTTDIELSLSLNECGDEIECALEYASDLFEHDTIQRMLRSWERLLEGLASGDQQPINRLPILTAADYDAVVRGFNDTTAPYPADRLIHELFEEQVERTPDAISVLYEEQVLTYAALNEKANRLARYLFESGMSPGELIPVLMPRCLNMLVAQLAVLKCGGVYVPVDPKMPTDRQIFTVRDCGARRIIAETGEPAVFQSLSLRWIDYAKAAPALEALPAENLALQLNRPAPAYVLYTSGSTGIPKGVIIPHGAVNRITFNAGYAEIEPTDCVSHASNPSFDASTFEIWAALLKGARVLIVPAPVVLDAQRFPDLLRQHGVTVLFLTTALFNQYALTAPQLFAGLRYVLFGGEASDTNAVRKVLQESRPQHLLNMYGPTETTTFATWYPVTSVPEDASSLPIGKPISNTQIYILDDCQQPVPIGVAGEICIGGPGVAISYLNRPELTAERFIADPFSSDPEARLYKSGDLGRWRSDGNIEFLGRNDQQVKLRGFRVELGEIEARLLRHPSIKQVAVVARADDSAEKRLVAYVVAQEQSDSNALPSIAELREHLRSALPEYMVPSAFVWMESLPLTVNGKLDKRALPRPEPESYMSHPYEAPEGEIEEVLADIWHCLLPAGRIGRQDNFFELGGNSLVAMQVMTRIRSSLAIDVPTSVLFECPTVQQLAMRVEDLRDARLLEDIERGGKDIDELLEQLTAMPESQVQEMMQRLINGGGR
jgi:amino acid adenylation domain-containing protein